MNDAVLTAGSRLLVRFIRTGDRWAHGIHFGAPRQSARILQSLEGVAEENWPPSPPLQSMERHVAADGRQHALLVGMASGSHWSASVEADEAGEQVFFDVACRISDGPQWLGSCYVLSGFPSPLPRPSADKRKGENGTTIVIPRIELDESVSRADGIRPVVETTGRMINVRVECGAGPLPRTVRWRYVVKLDECRVPW